jgi:ribokinase
MLQLEIPLETVCHAVKRLAGKTIILDPAPAVPLPDDIYPLISYITPNETELEILTGIADFEKAGKALISKGVGTVIAKAGAEGAYIITADTFEHVPPFAVNAVDTTAAGDSFNAGFAFYLSKGHSLYDSVRFGNAVGALSTTAHGAQGAMPTHAEVIHFING